MGDDDSFWIERHKELGLVGTNGWRRNGERK